MIEELILGMSLGAMVGPVTIEVINRGIKYGFLAAFLVSVGTFIADITYFSLIYLGLASVMKFSLIRIIIGIFGGAFLIYSGFKSIRYSKKKSKKIETNKKLDLKKSSAWAGFIIAISSPMTIVSWVAIFGPIINQTGHALSTVINCFVVLLGVVLWYLLLSATIHYSRRFINQKWMQIISIIAGLIIIYFGIEFVYKAYSLIPK